MHFRRSDGGCPFWERSRRLWHGLRRGWYSLALVLTALISAYVLWVGDARKVGSSGPEDVPPTPINVDAELFPYFPSPATLPVAPGSPSSPTVFPARSSPGVQAAQGVAAAVAVDDSLERGIRRLTEMQEPDGSWGQNREVAPRDTHVVLEALRRSGKSSLPAYRAGVNWFRSLVPTNNDYLARQLHALSMAGEDVSGRRYRLVDQVVERVGYCHVGTAEGRCQATGIRVSSLVLYIPDIATSGLTVSALTAAGYREDTSRSASVPLQLFWLLEAQNDDGGWGWGYARSDVSRVLPTALVLEALLPFRSESIQTVPGGHVVPIGPAVDKGLAWLKAQQETTSGTWGDGSSKIRLTALALAAMLELGNIPTNLDGALSYLRNAQQVDGGWGSAYDTAVVVRALSAKSPTQPPAPPQPIISFFRYAGDGWLALPTRDNAEFTTTPVNDQFRTVVKVSNRALGITLGASTGDFRLSLQARRTTGTTGEYGVDMGIGAHGFTRVVVRPQERGVGVFQWDAAAGQWITILLLSNVAGLNGGGLPDVLQLDVTGQRVAIAVNGHQVGSFAVPQYVPGTVALMAAAFTEPGFAVNWDFVEAGPISAPQSPTGRSLFGFVSDEWQQLGTFDSPDCSQTFSDNRLVMRPKGAGKGCIQRLYPGLQDLTVVAQVQQTAGASGELFVDLGIGPTGYLRVRIHPLSRGVGVFRWNAATSSFATFFNQGGLDAVNFGVGLNELRINVQGQEIAVFVNNREVIRISDPDFVPGYVFLGVGAFDDSGFAAAWNLLEVTALTLPEQIVGLAGDTWKILGSIDSTSYQRLFQAGELITKVKMPNLLFHERIAQAEGDVSVTARVRRAEGTVGDYAIVFGKGLHGFTQLQVLPHVRAVELWHWDTAAAAWTRLFRKTGVVAVNLEGGSNILRADVLGRQIAIYINEELVEIITDDKYRSGEIALATGTFAEGGFTAAWESVKVIHLTKGLVFTGQPVKGAHGFTFGVQLGEAQVPRVVLREGGGTLISDSTTVVNLRIKPGTGTPGSTLTCDKTTAGATSVEVTNGVAAFTGCKIDLTGEGYVLEATAQGIAQGSSQPFNIVWAGDANADCLVDTGDFSLMVRGFGKRMGDSGFDPRPDLNGDNLVDIGDFSILVALFGTRCPVLTLTPASGEVGTLATVKGSAYVANLEVTITFDDALVTTAPATIMTDGKGDFEASFPVPVGAASGNHVVKASQRSGTVVSTKVFTVP